MTGRSYSLQGVSAGMWHAFVEYGNVEDVASALAKVYDVDEARLREDATAFAAQLLAAGLLEQSDDGSSQTEI